MEEGTPNDFSRSGTDPIKISDGDQSNSSQGNQNQSYSPGQNAPQDRGFKVDVTPSSPIQPSTLLKQTKGSGKKKNDGRKMLVVIPIILAILIATAFVMLNKPTVSSTTTVVSTTISPIHNITTFSACMNVSKPGKYYLSRDIKTGIQSGGCINVYSDNVALVCNQNHITGSGPYSNTPPLTAGVSINGRDNVSVEGCVISNFSYGITAFNSKGLKLTENNASQNTLSQIYLSNVSSSIIKYNFLSRSSSPRGALYITNSSQNNSVLNNTIVFNSGIGIRVNSTDNNFVNNYVQSNPIAFYCSADAGFSNSNYAASNICYNQTGCNFVTCDGINIPDNVSSITLGPRVSSCGSITAPGGYGLVAGIDGNINSAGQTHPNSLQPCISILSSNVQFNCNDYPISNTSIGIVARGVDNVSLYNCKISKSAFGIIMNRASDVSIYNTSVERGTMGVLLTNSSNDTLKNFNGSYNDYGIYFADSDGSSIQRFTAINNTYGVYLNSSFQNSFYDGFALNNSRIDVYADPAAANATANFMSGTKCGLSNTYWSTCTQHVSPTLSYYPIDSCTLIKRSGNYTLTGNIDTNSTRCIAVNADNVKLSCGNHTITQISPSFNSTGIYVNGRSNVSISACNTAYFRRGIAVYNSTGIYVNGTASGNQDYGILLSSSSNTSVYGNSASRSGVAAIALYGTYNSSIYDNAFGNSKSSGIGIYLKNSTRNYIFNNTGSTNYIGVYLNGSSRNNTIYDNTMQLSGSADYECSNYNSNITAENNGVNYGTRKAGCYWLAALSQSSPAAYCTLSQNPSVYTMSNDYVYTYGNTCYGIYSNYTTINCEGHTVIATHGGTFAYFKNANKTVIENCYLKGFTTPIVARNSSVDVINNTISLGQNATSQKDAAISVSNSQNIKLEYNNISDGYYGIYAANDTYGYIQDNFANATYPYYLEGLNFVHVLENTASKAADVGMSVIGSEGNLFSNNLLSGIKYGLLCGIGSSASDSNNDFGGNSCSSEYGCEWINESKATCS